MQKLRVIAVSATLHHGKVRLNERQAHDRAHQVRPLDDAGTYEILSPISFKAGEEFEFDGPINKLQLATLQTNPPEESEAEVTEGADPAETSVEAAPNRNRGRGRRSR